MNETTISKDTKRAVIYARVSTDDQDCARQVADLTAWAKRAGYCLVCAPYIETASGMKTARKARAEIIAQAQRRQIDTVLVTELSRWGRSTIDLLDTIEQLASYGVSLEALNGMTFDLKSAHSRLILRLLAGLSEFERDLIAERTKSGLAHARSKGVKLGRPQGNKTDEQHRDAVLELHGLGFSYREIASKLRIGKDTVGRVLKASATS
ncbi:MAG: recombinase family protein [Candidatus Obscuribacterales bacterium]|nr:recombinase family protein [Candidatus Obscuribacterales bacterium]